MPWVTQAQAPCEPIGSLPYFNDFEDEPFNSGTTSTSGSTSALNAFPNCWVRINDGTGNRQYPFITSESNYVINGSKSMSWSHSTYNNYAENEYAVLPPINQNLYDSLISNLSMSFVARTNVWIAPFPIFIVGVMLTPNDTTSFVAVDTITLSHTATLYTVDFANYIGSGKYIAIRFPRNGVSRLAILDDVYLNLTSQWCNPPTNLSAHSTDSEITLTWNANGNSSFTVTLGDNTINGVTDTFYTFSNLHDSTLYNYAVASECPFSNSIFINGSIQTECHPLTYDDFPFTEDFESYGTYSYDPISPCWHRGMVGYYNGMLTRLCRFEIDNDTAGLSLSARYEYPYDYSSWVALPRLADTVDVSDLEIQFMVKRPSTGVMPIPLSCLVVGVSSDITNDTSFVTVDTIDLCYEPVNSIIPVTVRFENYTGSGKYIVIKAVIPPSDSPGTSTISTTSCAFAIDNVILQLASPCPTPQNVQVTGTTATSANALWDFDNHADSCFIYIGTPGFSIDTATPSYVWHSSTTITDNIVGATIDSLSPNTEYEIIIASNCNGNISYGSHPVLFRTLCAPIDILPFYEDFESVEGLTSIYYYGVNVMVPCWQYYNEGMANEGTGYPRVHNSPSYAHSGSNALRFNTHNSQTPPDYTAQFMYYTDQIAIMPITDSTLYPLSNLLVSFWSHVGENNSCSMIVEVGVMSDPFDTSTFIPVSTITHYNANYFDFNVVGFANYTGPHGHVAFKAPIYTPLSHAGANQFYIDDITLEEIPNSCPPISTIHAEATASAARLTWEYSTEFGTPTGFEVNYRNIEDSIATTVYTTSPEAIITGLAVDSTYWASVAAECNGLYGGADTIIFHTLDLPCVDWDTTDIQGDTLILGNPGTGTTYMFPVNAMTASSKVQHLFLASEIPVNGPTTLKGIGFDYAYNMPAVWAANCTIWLAHTTVDSMSNSFVSGQQLVYEGSLAFSEPGWNYVLFNQGLFEYDGVSNLCITIEKNWNNPANTTNYTFRYETTEDRNMTCWGYRTPRPVGAYIMSTNSNNMRSNTRLITSGDVYCGRWATCMPPIIHVDSSIIGTYRLFWVPGYHETSWNVDYRIADTGTWITAISETSVNEYTITISELEYDTRYEFRVTANCSDTAVSDTISFYTSCTYIDIPFYYDFDGLPLGSSTEPAYIHCWTHLNNGRIYNGSPYITTYAHSGNRGLSFFGNPNSGYGDYGIMVLPPVDTAENPINSLYLNFWAKTPSAKIYVGVMTDPTDVNTYTPVDTVVVEHDDNQWDLLEASFNNYVGEGQYIALRTNRGDGGGMIDDITVTDRPICRRVHNIKVRNVTTDSATIFWTRGNDETAWELNVGDRTFYLADTIFNVHNLVSDTPYDVSVRAICNEGDTSVPTFTFFQTPCYLLDSLPYMNDFENEPYYSWTMGEGTNYYYAFPACWRRLHDYRTANNFSYHHPYVCSANDYLIHGSKSLYWDRSGGPNKAYVVLPPIDLGVFRMDSLYLSFYAKDVYSVSGAPTQLIVGALANSSDTTSFEPVDTITLTNTNTLYTVRFNNYTGTNNYIAICLPQYNNERNVSIDDIYLTNHWCDAPSNLISTATATDVTLSWNGNGVSSFTIFLTADSVVYDPVNEVTYTVPGATDTITGVTDTVYTFHNLSDSTVYNYRVATECFGALGMSLTGSIQTECRPMVYDELPYYEDFEAYGNHYQSSISRCWHRGGSQQINGFYQPRLGNFLLDADTVGLSFSADASSHSFCWASLPRLDESVNISDLEINLLIKRPTSGFTPIPNTTLVVGVSTDIYSWYSSAPLESSDFVPVDTIDFSDEPVNTIHNATVRFDNYTGNGKYIVLMAPEPTSATTNSNGFTIDNVTLNIANPCHIPEHVTVTRTTWDSLYATWDGDSNVNSWTLYIGSPGFFGNDSLMGSGNILTYQLVNNYAAIGNLNPNTDYELVVVANCNGSESDATFPVQFHTLCSPIDNLPFTEDFESVAGIPSYTTYAPSNTLPDCWLRYNSSISNTSLPLVHNDATIAHSGTNAIYFANSNNSSLSTDLIAIMPLTDATLFPIWNLQVSFWMRCAHGYNSYIVVGVMSDPTDTNTFVAIDTVYTYSIELHNNTMVYSEHTVSFANYTGPHGNVAFKAPRIVHTLVGVNYPYIDDITIKELPCASADNLRTLSIGADSITIAWGDTSNASIYWYVEYDTVEFTPGTGSVTPISVTDTFYTMTGLDSGTVYHIYVYPNCPDSVGYSYLSAFTLLSTPSSVPYASDFEDSGSNGWVLINGSQVNYWMVGNVTGNPGSSLYITDDGSSNNYSGYTSTVFAIRTLHFDSAGEYAYSFDWKCNGESGSDYLEAVLIPAQNILIPGQLQSLNSQSSIFNSPQLCQRTSWQSLSGSFSITSPGNYVWVFMWHNDSVNYNQTPAAIDNFKLIPNTCPMPLNVSGDLSANRLILTWVPGGSESEWEVSLGSSSVIVNTPSYTFTNLTPTSSYTVHIRSICGEGDTSLAVTTLFNPRRYRISVAANNPAFGWVTGDGMYYYGDIATLSASPYSGYFFYEWNDGDTNNPRNLQVTSDTLLTAIFSQQIESIDKPQISPDNYQLSIIPNPAKGTTTVSIAGINGKVRIALLDMTGRKIIGEVFSIPDSHFSIPIDIKGLPSGAYFVRVTSESHAPLVKKLIIR